MVKIRKKTSKRTTVRMRSKIAKKSAESVRKGKKAAKKDVTWKSNKPKDIGIPNSFPYKDQLLAEAQAEKLQAEADRLARKEASRSGATLASTAALAAAIAADSQRAEDEMLFEEELSQENQVADASLKLHAKSLRKVLEASDIILEILDARDPIGTRCRAVERELKSLDGGRKKLILVLNKIDLVPAEIVQGWLKHLRQSAPTIPFKSSTQQQRKNLSASSHQTPNSASGSSTKPLMELIKGFRLGSAPNGSTETKVKQSITIGLIGHPNVGKSSLINTLKRSKACAVAPTPGWTKEVQEVVLEKGVRVLDCPGVVVEARGEVEGALRGMVKPEEIRDPKAAVELILSRCKKQHLQMLYNIPNFDGILAFLLEVARAKGRLRKGGVPDLEGTARQILRDWNAGRIGYYTQPPAATAETANTSSTSNQSVGTVSENDVDSSTLLTEFAPAFDLAGLFGEADAIAFGEEGTAGSAIEGKAVKMSGFEGESEDANVGWVTGEAEDEMEEDSEGEVDVEDLLESDEEAGMDEDEDEEMDEDIEPEVIPTPAPKPLLKSTKRSAPSSTSNIVSVAPQTKKSRKSVSFSATPLGPTGTGSASSTPVTSASLNVKSILSDQTSAISVNKSIQKNAKKEKKKAKKLQRAEMEIEPESVGNQAAESESKKPRGKSVVRGHSVTEAYNFEEFFGKPGTAQPKMANDENSDEEL